MVKFGVWVVDLMLQYTVGILNAVGHGRGEVVWLALTLGLGLVGLKTFALYLATVLQFKATAFLAGEFIISIFNCCSFRTAGSPDIFAGCFITEINDWALNFYSASKS